VVEGPSVVRYQRNGWCEPHTVELSDDRNPELRAVVAVDALSSVKTYGQAWEDLRRSGLRGGN
jgi:hypothetical protein